MALPAAVRIKRQDGTWQDLAIQGAIGPQGPPGPQGADGVPGVPGPPAYENAPLGAIQGWSRKALPDGWVMADGASYTQAAFPEGFVMAQAEVAAGNPLWTAAASSFTVPNLTDKFVLAPGASRTLGQAGGEAAHLLTGPESGIATHSHQVFGDDTAYASNSYYVPQMVKPYSGAVYTSSAGGAKAVPDTNALQAHNNLPPYVVIGQIVKLKGATVSAGAIQGPKGDKGDATDPTPLDSWHVVGAAGEPAFGTGWSSYPAEVPVAFRKDPFGKVMLRGLAQIGSTPNAGPIFTLPVGYRPPNGFVRFPLYRGGDTTIWTAYVGIDGRVMLFQAPAASQYYDLAPIEFDTDSVATFPVGPRGPAGPSGSTAYSLPSARAATTASINLAANAPASVDGVALASGDLVLVWQQTNKAENGLYQFSSSAASLARASSAGAGAVLEAGTRCYVMAGTLFGNRDFFVQARQTVGSGAVLLSPPRGSVLDEQEMGGQSNDYHNLTAAATYYSIARHTSGSPLFQVAYTPPVDCWLDVSGIIYAYMSAANYTYVQERLLLAPADVDGIAGPTVIQGGLHSGVVNYNSIHIRKKFKLAAGVAYTCTLQAYSQTAGIQIYRGTAYDGCSMRAELRVR